MIPMIGTMVGAYIITRMLSFITRKGERCENGIVVVFSVITLLIAIFCVVTFLADTPSMSGTL